MDHQIKERCIYCGGDVYYTGREKLIKCAWCGHTLVVAKFENELARMNQALEEGEQAKKDLAEAEKARQDAQVRLLKTLDSLAVIQSDQDILSKLMKSVVAGQQTAEDKLAQVKSISERILKNQGNIFEGMHILDEIKGNLQLIGMDVKATQDYAMSFMTWFQNIHEDDKVLLEKTTDQSSKLLAEQKKIKDKIDLLHQTADKTKKTLDEFHNQWKESQLKELRQLYHQAENYQHDRIYDKAYDKYEQIVIKGGGDSEVLWRQLLCHYGVSYQQSDEKSRELIPIILNPDLTAPEEMSLRKDLAIQIDKMPAEQKMVYESELAKIDRILSKYRLIRGSVAYDVFISVKQQRDGNPTKDSFAAVTLYNTLTAKGLKVFNSRLTSPPAGQEYEPYIISALMSAKAMIVVGTCRENMEAQWVKNEWSRFQWLQQREKKLTGKTERVLLCYLAEGMIPEDIPRGLNPNKQAIKADITADQYLEQALAFLLHEKRVSTKEENIEKGPSAGQTIVQMTTWLYLKRFDKVLEKYEFLTERGLYLDQAQVHLCALCAEKGTPNIEQLVESEVDLGKEALYQLALRVSCGTDEQEELNNKLKMNVLWRKEHLANNEEQIIEVPGKDNSGGKTNKVPKTELKEKEYVDYEIDWKDENLEKKMREITGITDRKIMYSDVKETIVLNLTGSGIANISSLENLKNLQTLKLRWNQISDISGLKNLTNLEALDLSYNEISDISGLENLTNLETLYLNFNEISDISGLKNLTNLEALDLSDNEISDISSLENLTNLETLYLCSNFISDISGLKNLINVKNLNLGYNDEISDFSVLTSLPSLTELGLKDNAISDISSLKNLIQLKSLDLDSNGISDISDLTNLTNLETLYLRYNAISDINSLKNLTKLKTLYLDGNEISDISGLTNLTNLTELSLVDIIIGDISSLENLINLEILCLNHTEISDISGLKNLTELKTLNLSFNKISDISGLKNLTKLKTLNLSFNKIGDISILTNLTNLKVLDLQNTEISDISMLMSLTKLIKLNLGDTKLSKISVLARLKNLEDLNLARDRVEDISTLKDLTNLKVLNLHSNGISDISFLKNLTNLEDLNLTCNRIEDISALKNLTNLNNLDLRSNPGISDYSPVSQLRHAYIRKE